MTKVTPGTIAYAAVQVSSLTLSPTCDNTLNWEQARFFLSTAEVWGPEDGDFNLEQFYLTIVELFEPDPGDPGDNGWATATLAWWDR